MPDYRCPYWAPLLGAPKRHDAESFTGLAAAVSEHITEVVANAQARRTRSGTQDVAFAVELAVELAPIVG
ncbi:hypothetical protein ACFL2H_04210 [Planctomycetota bacterium]